MDAIELTPSTLKELPEYERKVLVPLVNLILGDILMHSEHRIDQFADFYRQALFPKDYKRGNDLIKRTLPGSDASEIELSEAFLAMVSGSDLVVDAFSRSPIANKIFFIEPDRIKEIAKITNPHHGEGLRWDKWGNDSIAISITQGLAITRRFLLAYVHANENPRKEG